MQQRSIILAMFSGLLLHCSFAFSGGVFLAIVSLVLLFYAVDSCPEAGKASGIILLTLSAWHIGQYEFLICKIGSSGWQVLLVIFLSILVAWIPVCVTLIIGKDLRKSDVLMVGLLVSEFVYSKIPIGNQLFQFGVLLASFPEIIQWEKITGLYFASLWLGVLSLYLYKSIFVNPKCYRVLLFVLFVPFLVSLGIFFFSSPSSQTETTTVSVLPMKNEKDRQELYHQLQSGCFKNSDFLVLPEGILSVKEGNSRIHPLNTLLHRISKRDSVSVIAGIFEAGRDYVNNYLQIITPDGRDIIRYKTLKIPFSEYMPCPIVLGKLKFFMRRMIYPLSEIRNLEDTFLSEVDVRIAPLICYEALSTRFACKLALQGAQMFFVSSSNTWIDKKYMEHISRNIISSNAIITGRSYARSVENGRSFAVNRYGKTVFSSIGETRIKTAVLYQNLKDTFYAKHSIAIDLTYIILLILIVSRKRILCLCKKTAC